MSSFCGAACRTIRVSRPPTTVWPSSRCARGGFTRRSIPCRPPCKFAREPVLLNNLGICLLLRKEYVRALEHFTGAAGLVPENEKYRANMATALGLLGRQEESLALLQQILPGDKAQYNAEVLRNAHDKETHQNADVPAA